MVAGEGTQAATETDPADRDTDYKPEWKQIAAPGAAIGIGEHCGLAPENGNRARRRRGRSAPGIRLSMEAPMRKFAGPDRRGRIRRS